MSLLTFETLITCNPFYLGDILAGWNGRKNQIQHVFLNELPTQNNSVLLVRNPDKQLHLLENSIKDKHTSGIVIFAEQKCYVESSIIDLANELKKPLLFLINQEEIHLYETVAQILHLSKNNLLHIMKNDMTSYWLQLFFQHTIQHVIQRLNTLMGQEALFFTTKKQFIAIVPTIFTGKDFTHMKTVDDYSSNLNNQVSVVHNGKLEFYSFTILDPNEKIIGYFLFEKIHKPEDLQLQLLQTIIPTMMAWLKQTESTRHVHLKYRDQFMFDILYNNIETESELIELGKLREMEFVPNACVLAMNLQSNRTITTDIRSSIQSLMIEDDLLEMNIYTTYLSHRIVAIILPSRMNKKIVKADLDDWISRIQNQISEMFPSIQTIVGVGRSYYSNIDIYRSFQEAKIALQMHVYGLGSNGIIHYEDIGYVRLLSYIHNDLLDDFSNQYLGELEKHDKLHETDLVHTLSTFCSQNVDIIKTADILFVHQNTLRQRLRKIESILNVQLNNYTDLVNLLLSLKISQSMNA